MIWVVIGLLFVWVLILSFRDKGDSLEVKPGSVWHIPPKTYKEIYEELKAEEKLKKEYKLVRSHYLMGKKIDKPTAEQLADYRLLREEKWVKK